MVRCHSKTHTYDAPWDEVTSAFWIKYPNNRAHYVKSVDTIAREVDVPNKTVRQKRLLALEYHMPSWIESVFGCKVGFFSVGYLQNLSLSPV